MNWLKALRDAPTIDDVIALVNEYLSSQSDEFWELIPARSRPTEVNSEPDLHRWHQQLVEEVASATSPPNIKLQDLCVFFLRASVRVHQIALRNGDSSSSSNDNGFFAAAARTRRA